MKRKQHNVPLSVLADRELKDRSDKKRRSDGKTRRKIRIDLRALRNCISLV